MNSLSYIAHAEDEIAIITIASIPLLKFHKIIKNMMAHAKDIHVWKTVRLSMPIHMIGVDCYFYQMTN